MGYIFRILAITVFAAAFCGAYNSAQAEGLFIKKHNDRGSEESRTLFLPKSSARSNAENDKAPLFLEQKRRNQTSDALFNAKHRLESNLFRRQQNSRGTELSFKERMTRSLQETQAENLARVAADNQRIQDSIARQNQEFAKLSSRNGDSRRGNAGDNDAGEEPRIRIRTFDPGVVRDTPQINRPGRVFNELR